MSDETRHIYERLSPEDLASLPPELRMEFQRQQSGARAESRRSEAALAAAQRIPPNRRDMTPVTVLVHARNKPMGEVFTEVEEEVTVDDGVERIKVEDGVDKNGDTKYKAVEVKKTRQELQKVTKLVSRHLTYKERVTMPRWIVDLMAGNDHVVEL